jgi:hypothetical protein
VVQALEARLELGSNEVSPGDALTYEIVNEGTATLVCGYAYRLERQDELDWTVINRESNRVARGARRERQLRAQISAEAQSGQYRIGTTVRQEPPATSPPLHLTALFEVR